jgi:hypothetical protein
VSNLFLLLMLNLRLTIGILETRAAQMGSPASSLFRCCLFRPSGSSVTDHAPAKFSLRLARGGFVPAFFCRAKAVAGHWGADLMAGGFRGGACCTRAGLRRRQCSPPTFGLNFLLDVFVYSLVSMYNCLCVAQVLLEFSLLGG